MPRKYNIEKRAQAQEDTRRRILDAALKLHARQGGVRTTHAEIAALADVATPTVYKYFPDRHKLAEGCTAHAMSRAPLFGPELFDGLSRAEDRLGKLAVAVFELYDYLHPWMRWGEDRVFPEVRAVKEEGAAHVRRMLELAVEPAGKAVRDRSFLAVASVLLGYPAWEEWTQSQKLAPAKAARMVAESLVALLRPN